MGAFQGELKDFAAPELGAAAIRAAVERAKIKPEHVQEVIMGCVLPAGQGQAPARQASLGAGLPLAAGCTTVNKMCGSGMKAAMLAHDLLLAGTDDIMVAGGMESMTNAPYLLPKARAGFRMGHGQVIDHMFYDGLEDAYDKGRLMGSFAEDCAQKYRFTREAQDAFAVASLQRAQKANKEGSFAWEITPLAIKAGQGRELHRDGRAAVQGQPREDPDAQARVPQGRHGDGGELELDLRRRRGAGDDAPLDWRKSAASRRSPSSSGHTTHAQEPGWFTTAPVGAIKKLLERTGWSAGEVDLYEINEAFAVVTMAAMQELGLPHEKVNVHGGACALGHPIGASGARILVTLIGALRKYGGKRGVASLCIGGGEATAMAIELA